MEILRIDPPVSAVNVSAIQLQQKDFVSMVADVLRNAGNFQSMQLEITEANQNDIEANIEKLSLFEI